MEQELEHNEERTLNQWLVFMLEKVGHNNLSKLLDYYEDLGWIGTDVTDKLIDLSEIQKQQYVGPSWTLSAEEHRISMLYIEKLQGKPVEISLLSTIAQAKAKPQQNERETPREGYIESHRLEKNELEISNLKQIIQELEFQLNEKQDEIKKNRIYKGIFEENIRLRKVNFRNNF